MSQIRKKNRSAPSLYNPGSQTDEEIISNFVIRIREFNSLFNELKNNKMENPPQHFIIQGQRGYGKTTLLLRLNIEIERDKKLNKWLLPVLFDEEQYHIRTLAGLWEEVIKILGEQDDFFLELSSKMDLIYNEGVGSPEEKIFKLLIDTLNQKNKKLVLLLDNFGDMIKKFSKKEEQRLREVLITCNDIRLIGASSVVLESSYEYKEPFFDFFKVITLNELNREETNTLLKKVAGTYNETKINEVMKEHPEKVEAIRRLTGGVPRTILLLFEIFNDDFSGESIQNLELILDRVTPLYKQRLDNLSSQQQAIIDAIALNWDAISTKEIAETVRMESKTVSSQINQLIKNQLVRKIKTSTKNHLYQLSERFFNVYYLMRLGKRNSRKRVLWLTRFYEIWCSKEELVDITIELLNGLFEKRVDEKYFVFYSMALIETKEFPFIQQELKKALKKNDDYSKKDQKELDKSNVIGSKEIIEDLKNDRIISARQKLKEHETDVKMIDFKIAELYRNEIKNLKKAEKYYLMAIEKDSLEAMFNLATLYNFEYKDSKKAEKYLLMAMEKGLPEATYSLGALYHFGYKDYKKAEKYYLKAIEKGLPGAIYSLGALYYFEFKDYKKAEKYFLMAIEKGSHEAMYNLALMYKTENNEIEKTMKVFNKFFLKEKSWREVNEWMTNILIFFLANGQLNFVYNLFKENKFAIKDKYKPIYYALLKLMGEDKKDEYLRMGSELEETVNEILAAVEKLTASLNNS